MFRRHFRGFAFLLALGLLFTACDRTHISDSVSERGADARKASNIGEAAPPAGEDHAPGRILARFRPGANIPEIGATHGAAVQREIALGIQLLSVPEGRELAISQALSRNPNVVFAEPDFVRTFGPPIRMSTDLATPNDPFFGYKWDLHNDGTIRSSTGAVLAQTGKAGADMDWLEAYNHLGDQTGDPVLLGILDTGIRATHEAFSGKVHAQHNFHSGTGNAADDDGHGTHVAGIATALGNDGAGVPGVAYGENVRLVIAKVCGPLRPPVFGQRYGCYSSSIVDGIKWAADQGAVVMNLSLGGSSASNAEQEALQYARSKGALPICAAGNNQGSVSYPARFPECVAVSATTWSDELASYSNSGPEIELSAPGGDSGHPDGYSYILSAYHQSNSSYAFMAGTSMASPQVAGLAVLLHGLGMADHAEKLTHIKNTADDIGPANRFGAGRINIHKAVASFSGGTPPGSEDPPENLPPVADFAYNCDGLTCGFTDASTDADGEVVAWSWDFGDGSSSTIQHPSHTYINGGTYTVALTVTDDKGATDPAEKFVSVAPLPGDDPDSDPDALTLQVTGYKVRGLKHADLTWEGATSNEVDIIRDGATVATVAASSGTYTHATNERGGGSHTYWVCEAGTATCSNDAVASY